MKPGQQLGNRFWKGLKGPAMNMEFYHLNGRKPIEAEEGHGNICFLER